jgi:hypothetical protein
LFQVFHLRKDFCYVFSKLLRICGEANRRLSFEAVYRDKATCADIFRANQTSQLCSGR